MRGWATRSEALSRRPSAESSELGPRLLAPYLVASGRVRRMLKNVPALVVCLSLAACCTSSPAATDTTSAGNGPSSSAGSTGLATTGGTSSGGTTGSATGSATGSVTGTGTGTGSVTGTGAAGSSTGALAGWTVVGSLVDPGQGDVFVSDLVPLPGPSSLPQVVFTESLGGIVGVFTTYWDGGYVAPELIFDGGSGDFYNLQGANWHQGSTNLVVAINFNFNLITLAPVDGGPS